MSGDKSARERAELTARILGVERQEDEFSELRKSYEHSLEQFRERFHSVGRRRDSFLDGRIRSGDRSAQQELEARQELLFQVDRYVEESVEELEETSSSIRRALDDEREKLLTERSGLPWE